MNCGDQGHTGVCLGRRPCTRRSQGTTPSASDLHNARATILNPVYGMVYKIFKKITQNKTWIEAAIPYINLTPDRYNALASRRCLLHQWRHNPSQPHDVTIATQITLLRTHVNGTEIVLKSTDRRSKMTLFLDVQGLNHGCLTGFISREVSKMWRILMPRILKNNDL